MVNGNITGSRGFGVGTILRNVRGTRRPVRRRVVQKALAKRLDVSRPGTLITGVQINIMQNRQPSADGPGRLIEARPVARPIRRLAPPSTAAGRRIVNGRSRGFGLSTVARNVRSPTFRGRVRAVKTGLRVAESGRSATIQAGAIGARGVRAGFRGVRVGVSNIKGRLDKIRRERDQQKALKFNKGVEVF